MSNLIDYSLYDNDGNVYTTRIPQREANIYELDQYKRHRLLEELKSRKDPVRRWDQDSYDSFASPASDRSVAEPLVANTGPSVPQPQCSVSRAQGKTGGVWKGTTTYRFLQYCSVYRKWLRPKIVSELIWRNISDKLYFEHQLDYSWEQLKEKMRNLKTNFKKAKKGELGGEKWEHYWTMSYIMDEPITDGEATLAPEGFSLTLLSAPQPNNFELLPRTSAPFDRPNTTIGLRCDGDATGPSEPIAVPVVPSSPPSSGFANLITSCVNVINNPDQSMQLDSNWENYDPPLSSTQLLSSSPLTLDNYSEIPQKNNDEVENNFLDLSLEERNNNQASVDVNQNLQISRSPAKKKFQNNEREVQDILRTPQKHTPHKNPSSPRSLKKKTPTRRNLCSQADLVWPPERVKMLLQECLVKKEKIQLEFIPLNAWKDISRAMKEAGVMVTWEICRGKFFSLLEYFTDKLLYTGGIVSGVKVPYYNLMCEIYDIPVDFMMPSNVPKTPSHRKLWEEPNIRLLISLYKSKQNHFKGTKSHVRHATLFSEIAASMAPHASPTGKQCKDKFDELKAKYSQEYDDCHRTGAPPSDWDYYKPMDELFGDSAAMKAPFILSLGTSNKYIKTGSESQTSQSGSRTRKSSGTEPKKPTKKSPSNTSGRATYKSRTVEAQETRVQQQDRLIDEMQQMRETYATQCTAQNELLRMLIDKAANKTS